MVKISIIVPVYNVENYLATCLDSLVNQTFDNYEIIVVNDGSTDNSQKIIDEYVSKYPKKIQAFQKENGGQASARNFALKKANGKFVIFVDSDDWVKLDMCEKLYSEALRTGADIVCCSFYKAYDINSTEEQLYCFKDDDSLKQYLLTQSGPCFKLIDKNIILKNDLFFPELRAYEDIAIVPIWGLYAKKISFLNEPLYYYLMRQGSTMKQIKYSKKLEQIFVSLNLLSEKFDQKYKEELEWIYIEHLLHSASLRFFVFNNYKKNIKKINKIIKKQFPYWYKNKYYKTQSIKYKIVCTLFYYNCFLLLTLLLKIKRYN